MGSVHPTTVRPKRCDQLYQLSAQRSVWMLALSQLVSERVARVSGRIRNVSSNGYRFRHRYSRESPELAAADPLLAKLAAVVVQTHNIQQNC